MVIRRSMARRRVLHYPEVFPLWEKVEGYAQSIFSIYELKKNYFNIKYIFI